AACPFRDAGAAEDQRYSNRVLVHVLFASEAVTADRQPVVAGKDNERVVRLIRGLERVHDAADLFVQVGDDGVVSGQLAAYVVFRAREGEQQFITAFEVAVVERMLRQEIQRQRRSLRIILFCVRGRQDQGIVR